MSTIPLSISLFGRAFAPRFCVRTVPSLYRKGQILINRGLDPRFGCKAGFARPFVRDRRHGSAQGRGAANPLVGGGWAGMGIE